MKYVFLAAFLAVSAVHLYASYIADKKLRAKTKPFILLFLLGWYCCSAPEPSVLIILALVFSWLGDVLLIPDGRAWFTAGGISFMASHAFFVAAYSKNVDFSVVPGWVIVLAALVYCTVTVFVFKGLKPYLPKFLFYPMFFYLLINGTMNCFALFQLISKPCLASAVTFFGATQFFVSDSTLFYVRFKKDGRLKTHFIVMLTYIIAEFLIVLGLLLLR